MLASQPATMPITAQMMSCWAFMFMGILPACRRPTQRADAHRAAHGPNLTDSSDHVEPRLHPACVPLSHCSTARGTFGGRGLEHYIHFQSTRGGSTISAPTR